MHHSVIVVEKPAVHLSLPDWHARVNQLRNVADACQSDAYALRQSARKLRNETRIASDFINLDSNVALADRIAELKRWREVTASTVRRIEKEIKMLREEKESTEHQLDHMKTPISIIAECLTMRDCRLGSEMTYDDADTEIKNELAVLENNQRLLADMCQKTWEKLNRLEDMKFKLGLELDNKAEGEQLDVAQLDLNKFAASITYKTDPLRNPKNCCSYEEWLEHTKSMKQLAENELADTYAMRETLLVCREKARSMQFAQQQRTEESMRKRIFETQRAVNELEWQLMKMKEEMARTVCEITALEQALGDNKDRLKLVQTRLENRAQRSGLELCLDDAHMQLCCEADRLRTIKNCITNKINETKTNYNMVVQHLQKMDVDLENKRHSLTTDQRALELHQTLKGSTFDQPNEQSPSAQTERNILLIDMGPEPPMK